MKENKWKWMYLLVLLLNALYIIFFYVIMTTWSIE